VVTASDGDELLGASLHYAVDRDNRHRLQIIDCLREENRVLREQLGGCRVRFNDDQRRRLAVKAKGLGRKILVEFATIVTLETLLAWHRMISKKYHGTVSANPGRIVQSGARDCLQYDRWDSAATRHRADAGAKPEDDQEGVSEPASGVDRGCGFLQRGSVDSARATAVPGLFFIDLATRRVEIAGIARTANGLWMSQIARNLTAAIDGILNGQRYLIHDRDPLFTTGFLNMLADVDVESVRLPPRSPNLNAHPQRFVRSI
jgi:putative transposase